MWPCQNQRPDISYNGGNDKLPQKPKACKKNSPVKCYQMIFPCFMSLRYFSEKKLSFFRNWNANIPEKLYPCGKINLFWDAKQLNINTWENIRYTSVGSLRKLLGVSSFFKLFFLPLCVQCSWLNYKRHLKWMLQVSETQRHSYFSDTGITVNDTFALKGN